MRWLGYLSRAMSSPLPLCYFHSLFLHTIVLFNASVTFNHPSITPSAHFNGPPIISPPSNILSTVPPSPHRSYLQSRGSWVIPRSCGIPFRGPFIHALLNYQLGALARMFMPCLTCMFVAFDARHGLRCAVFLMGVVQCKTA